MATMYKGIGKHGTDIKGTWDPVRGRYVYGDQVPLGNPYEAVYDPSSVPEDSDFKRYLHIRGFSGQPDPKMYKEYLEYRKRAEAVQSDPVKVSSNEVVRPLEFQLQEQRIKERNQKKETIEEAARQLSEQPKTGKDPAGAPMAVDSAPDATSNKDALEEIVRLLQATKSLHKSGSAAINILDIWLAPCRSSH